MFYGVEISFDCHLSEFLLGLVFINGDAVLFFFLFLIIVEIKALELVLKIPKWSLDPILRNTAPGISLLIESEGSDCFREVAGCTSMNLWL